MLRQLSIKSVRKISNFRIRTYKSKLQITSYDYIKKAIQEAENDIKSGKLYDEEETLKELRVKYGYR